MTANLPDGIVRALTWWTHDGVVHSDVPAPSKSALVRRGLAEWVDDDDPCPRLTTKGAALKHLLDGKCTAGWDDEPCSALAESGCDIDGKPACYGCFEGERAYWVPEEET